MPFILATGLLAGIVTFFTGLSVRWGMSWLFIGLSVLGSVVKKIMSFIGLAAVTYFGINAVSDQLMIYIADKYASLPHDVAQMLGIMRLDVGLSLIVSAGIIKQVLRGLDKTTDSKRERVWKTPDSIQNPYSGGGRTF